jgi:hypothetical protein
VCGSASLERGGRLQVDGYPLIEVNGTVSMSIAQTVPAARPCAGGAYLRLEYALFLVRHVESLRLLHPSTIILP